MPMKKGYGMKKGSMSTSVKKPVMSKTKTSMMKKPMSMRMMKKKKMM